MKVEYIKDILHVEGVSLLSLAEKLGTPLYVYSAGGIREKIRALKRAFGSHLHFLAYAVKANSNIEILRLIKKEGCGAEVVSGGELHRALLAGIHPRKIIFTGVGKTDEEIEFAIRNGIFALVCESEEELFNLERIAGRLRKRARVMLRVNPDVDPGTHPYIATGLKNSKFGIPENRVISLYERMKGMNFITPLGIHFHIGSQITSPEPFLEAAKRVRDIWLRLKNSGIALRFIDAGGGVGIDYRGEGNIMDAEKYGMALKEGLSGADVKIIIEPGRFIVGDNGLLIGKVLYLKENGDKRFIVTDIGMNDLIRPSLYNAYHRILPVRKKDGKIGKFDVVGPVCESGDFIARERELPEMERGEYIAVLDAGAYGFSMASNYNSRPRPAEVLVSGREFRMVRKRERYKDIMRGEG